MSFTSEVKNEVSKLDTMNLENVTELSAICRNIATLSDKSIKITTENSSVARRIFNLIKETYFITCKTTVRRGYNFSKNYIYILEVTSKIKEMKEDLNLDKIIPDEYIYADESLKRAYIRGLFLSCGSINDPKKSRYHLEFLVDNLEYANFVSNLLNEYFLNSKVLRRENKYMIYMKEAEKIGDFLRILETKNALFYYEDIRIYRDHKNMTNRLNNCEQANVDKIIMTSTAQIKDIEKLKKYDMIDLLDEKIQELIEYRLKYPESSLQELSEIISLETGNKITKSGLNHRYRKINDLAKKLKSEK